MESMDAISTKEFIEIREAKLGSRITWRTYSTWHASTAGAKREFGVFLYTDGKTLVFEDFERTPTLMGIPVSSMRKEKYEKYEISIPILEIAEINRVTRSSAEASFSASSDRSKPAGAFSKAFRKLVTRVKLKDGTAYFFELIDHRGFKKQIEGYIKGE